MTPRDPYAPPRDPPPPSDVLGWLFPREPRRLAALYLVVLLVCLAGGGALALVMRGELTSPEQDLVSAGAYNTIFALHGMLLALVFMLPAIPATLGYFVVPRQVGLDRLTFPWLGCASLHLFVAAVVVLVGSTLAAPEISGELHPVAALGVAGLMLSAVLTAIGLAATAVRGEVTPLFTASILLGSLATIVALTLPLIGVFARGRMELLTWAVMPGLALVPALGVVCEILEVHARRLVLVALGVLAAVSVPLWGMFAAGRWIAPALGRVAVVLLLCAWTVPIVRRRGAGAPLLYALAVVATMLLAGMVDTVRSAVSEVHFEDTYFVVGHFHLRAYVVVLALLGGLHRWWFELTGRRYHEWAGRVGAALVWAGMTVHAVATLALGHEGMPRRYYAYLPEFTELHRIATAGAALLAGGLVWVAVTLARSVREDVSGRG